MPTFHRIASYASGPCGTVVRVIGRAIRGPGSLLVVILAALVIFGTVAVSTVSAQSGSDPAPQVSAPGAPQNFRALVGGWHVTVGWRPPANDGGSPVTQYRLRYKRSDAGANSWLPAAEGVAVTSPHTITGLDKGQEYTVEVWAVNAFAGGGETKRPASLTAVPSGLTRRHGFPLLDAVGQIGGSTARYNCIAWAAGDNTRWYDSRLYWPPHVRYSWGVDALERLYGALGYEKSEDGSLEAEYLKVALYQSSGGGWTHAAIQTPSGIWQSKIGAWRLIEHLTPEAVGGSGDSGLGYGEIAGYMRRPRAANLPPIFAAKIEIRNVAENTAEGTPIGNPVATEDPEGGTLTYGLLKTDENYRLVGAGVSTRQATADAEIFTIDKNTGQLYVKGPLDYETRDLYKIVVTANDGNLMGSVVVAINVLDLQDEDSSPELPSGTLNLSDNQQVRSVRADDLGSVLIRWRTDDRADDNTYYRLRRRADPEGSKFQVIVKEIRDNGPRDADDNVGVLAYQDHSDDLVPGQIYHYGVRAFYDDGTKSKWTSLQSSHSSGSIEFFVAKGAAPGTAVGAVFAPAILDGDRLTYQIGGPSAAYFGIDANGQIRTLGVLNYDNGDNYQLTITATDHRKRSAILNVIVTDPTDLPPGQPKPPTFRRRSDSSMSFDWEMPAERGSPSIEVGLQYKPSSEPESAFEDVKPTPYQPTSLLFARDFRLKAQTGQSIFPGTSYDVRVRVRNAAGWGPWSEPASITTLGEAPEVPLVLPGQPDPPTFTGIWNNKFRIQWAAPSAGSHDIALYDLQYKPAAQPDSAFADVKPAPRSVGRGFNLFARSDQPVAAGSSYQVRVRAWSRAGWGPWSKPGTVITTGRSSKRAPLFADASIALRVAENTTAGTDIGDPVAATDPDGDALTYALGGADASHFAMDAASGQLSTKSALDYESNASYTVTVTATDPDGLSASVTVTIAVTDINEAPAYAAANIALSVAENTAAGTSIGAAVTATDPDGDALTYTLSGPDASHFTMDSATGQLSTKGPLDYEREAYYRMKAKATDPDGATDVLVIAIGVTNVNEAPAFADASVALSVAENTAAGTNIGDAITATDPDGDTLTYSLGTTADDGHFTIGAANGQIKTKSALDYESDDSYTVTVTATDPGGLSARATVTITVTDVPEIIRPENFQAELQSDGSVLLTWDTFATAGADGFYRVRRRTDTGDGKHVIIAQRVEDADHDGSVEYQDGGEDLAGGQSYRYSVRAFDASGSNVSKWSEGDWVEIPVRNRPPAFADASIARSVAENTAAGTNLGDAVAATDEDGDTLTYSLGSTADDGHFAIDSATGQLSTKSALDYESAASYRVTVTATNPDGQSASATVTITVTDVNEAPAYADASIALRVAENTAAGANLGDPVAATDEDGDTLTYALGGADADHFAIDSATGQLQTKGALDYETTASYTVTVTATDSDGLSASTTVTITVSDVADTPPGQPAPPTFTNIAETSFRILWTAPTPGSSPKDAVGLQYKLTTSSDEAWADVKPAPGTGRRGFNLKNRGGQHVTAGMSYDVRVRERNAQGWGPWSEAGTVTTAGTAHAQPGQPSAPTFTEVQERRFRILWQAPTPGASPITGYGLQYKLSSASAEAWADVKPAPSGVRVTGFNLTNRRGQSIAPGTSYDVRVRARNESGWGEWSETGTVTTAGTAPEPAD